MIAGTHDQVPYQTPRQKHTGQRRIRVATCFTISSIEGHVHNHIGFNNTYINILTRILFAHESHFTVIGFLLKRIGSPLDEDNPISYAPQRRLGTVEPTHAWDIVPLHWR